MKTASNKYSLQFHGAQWRSGSARHLYTMASHTFEAEPGIREYCVSSLIINIYGISQSILSSEIQNACYLWNQSKFYMPSYRPTVGPTYFAVHKMPKMAQHSFGHFSITLTFMEHVA